MWDVLGRFSFPLYLIHWPILVLVTHVIRDAPAYVTATAGFVSAIAGASVVLVGFDESVRAYLTKLVKQWQAAALLPDRSAATKPSV